MECFEKLAGFHEKSLARGKLHLHEFSFMSGDLVAALILLDFLYLVLADERA